MSEHTFLQLQQRVLGHVHGSRDTTSSNVDANLLSTIKDALNEALTSLTNDTKLMQMRRDGSITFVTSQETYDLPERMGEIVANTLFVDGNEDFPVGFISQRDWVRLGQENRTDSGTTEAVTYAGYNPTTRRHQLKVHPKPSSSESGKKLNFQYYETPEKMTADADIPPIPEHLHDGLVHGAIVNSFAELIDAQVFREVHLLQWNKYERQAKKASDPVMGRISPLRNAGSPKYPARIALRNFTIPTV